MAGCTYKIEGQHAELNESEFKAWLLNGGQANWYRVYPAMTVSERNMQKADVVVGNIVAGKAMLSDAINLISGLKLSDATKETMSNYIRQKLKDLRRGVKSALNEEERQTYNMYDYKFLNDEMTYEQVMYELGTLSTAAEQKGDQAAAEKFENMRNVFYKENHERAARQDKKREAKSSGDFNEQVNKIKLGLDESELTNLQSDVRVLRSGTQSFQDQLSFTQSNDQLRAMFKFSEYAQDLNTLIDKFQQQFGNDYMERIVDFIGNENNHVDARISASIALNRHLEYLLEREKNPQKRKKYFNISVDNAKASQDLGRRASLMLNSLRAWNDDRLSDMAWVGLVSPDVVSNAEVIRQALGDDISDADMFEEEDGVLNDESVEDKKEPDEKLVKKTAGYFAKKRLAKEAQMIKTPDPKATKEKIDKQKKECK